jgi:hypothetical protein
LELVRGFDSTIMRGLGELQKKQIAFTNYKIIGALYIQPHTYQQLHKATRIHKNTLKKRLDGLINENIIIKHHYLPNLTGGYANHKFYLLNWAKKESKEITSFLFEKQLTTHSDSLINRDIYASYYHINSIQTGIVKNKYSTVRKDVHISSNKYFSSEDSIKKIKELSRIERKIFLEISSRIYNNRRIKLKTKHILPLFEKRNGILESLVMSCMYVGIDILHRHKPNLSPYDLLVFFKRLPLFTNWRPYTIIWEIMVRMGY